jgi:GGDEF domain-containing protein
MQVAGRLRSAVASRAPEALVCRPGGDEFVAIVPDCGSPLTMSEIVSEVLASLSQPFVVTSRCKTKNFRRIRETDSVWNKLCGSVPKHPE